MLTRGLSGIWKVEKTLKSGLAVQKKKENMLPQKRSQIDLYYELQWTCFLCGQAMCSADLKLTKPRVHTKGELLYPRKRPELSELPCWLTSTFSPL